ncbi:uncharacterized protein LOC109862893 [Pseudomyrmex gracilis]|uniref:uncharacterized protein LOC109862893 n=1 Tax=Pseudomyrmex gracilis TaxID=219809 RepID=UPI0009950BBC|nr:uncharacterized protein LOC109862893 [Pseudomyrmex gracilis]
MVRICFLCKKKATKDANFTMHKFPKNSDYRHSTDLLCQKKWLLKPEAVPSIGVLNRPATKLQFQSTFKNVNQKCPIGDSRFLHESIDFGHDYIKTFWDLSPYVDNVVLYIAGYVSKHVSDSLYCDICRAQLVGSEQPLLLSIKNKKSYIVPSADLSKVEQTKEKMQETQEMELMKLMELMKEVKKVKKKKVGSPDLVRNMCSGKIGIETIC